MKKLISFNQFGSHEVVYNVTLLDRATPAVHTETFFQAANQYIFGWKNPFAFPPKDHAFQQLLHVKDFLSTRMLASICFCFDSVTEESVRKIRRIWGIWWPKIKNIIDW